MSPLKEEWEMYPRSPPSESAVASRMSGEGSGGEDEGQVLGELREEVTVQLSGMVRKGPSTPPRGDQTPRSRPVSL